MIKEMLQGFVSTLGIQYFTLGHLVMIGVGLLLIYLAIRKRYEPLLLLPIGFGAVLTNIPIRDSVLLEMDKPPAIEQNRTRISFTASTEGVKFDRFELDQGFSADFTAELIEVKALERNPDRPGEPFESRLPLADCGIKGREVRLPEGVYQRVELELEIKSGALLYEAAQPPEFTVRILRHAGLMDPGGLLHILYSLGVANQLFPLLIFLGVGAFTDFGPLLANPKTAILGAAAQFGIFTTLLGAVALGFSLQEAAAIGIIGGADGPTSIYIASKMADHLLGPIAIAAYSYMALVPIIQPPVMRLLTTRRERSIKMEQLKPISQRTRILFPIGVTLLCALIVPSAAPLIGMLMLGNLMRESGVVQRLTNTTQNELINIVTIFLGLAIGGKMSAAHFLTGQTISILLLGLGAFIIGTATGVLLGKLMCALSGGKINPLIGAAGVSAVPMAARVVELEGQKADPDNHLLMHAMGPNVAGVIGSAVAAGYFIAMIVK